ncbi:MAG: hypothetical protein Q9191_004681 [Dirinaria sp. TL-2023a]
MRFIPLLVALLLGFGDGGAAVPTENVQPDSKLSVYQPRADNLMRTITRDAFCFNVATRVLTGFEIHSGLAEAARKFVESGRERGQATALFGTYVIKVFRENAGATPNIDSVQALWQAMYDYVSDLGGQQVPEHMQGSVGSWADYAAQLGASIFVTITYNKPGGGHIELERNTASSNATQNASNATQRETVGADGAVPIEAIQNLAAKRYTFTQSCRDDARKHHDLYVFDPSTLPAPTCPAHQGCGADNCNGVGTGGFGSNTGQCQDNFKGCQCVADATTPGHCSSTPGSCDKSGCNGKKQSGGNNWACTGAFVGCPCTPPKRTCQAK